MRRPAVTHLRAGRDSERGAALMIVTISATLLLVLGLAIALETSVDEKVSHNYRVNVSALYVAEGGVDMSLSLFADPSSFTDTNGTYGGSTPYSGSPILFFSRRAQTGAGLPSFYNSFSLSQFADTNDDGVVDTTSVDPALSYDRDTSSQQAAFLDSLFPDASRWDYIQSLSIYAPPTDPISGESVGIATVRVTGVSKNAIRTLEQVLNPTYDAPGGRNIGIRALEAGLPAAWNGNPVLVHWGDVLIGDLGSLADADLGNNLGKVPTKDSRNDDGDDYANIDNSTFRGNGGEDRWTDILVTGTVVSPTKDYEGALDCRPWDGLNCLIGDEYDQDHGNIQQNYVPPLTLGITRLNYYFYRSQAQRMGSYYRTDSSGNLYKNGTGPAISFKNATDDGTFGVFFVDTFDGKPPAADGSNLATISINGDYYTKGVFYIGANLDIGSLGAKTTIAALSPPWDPLLVDPTSSIDPTKRISVNDLQVHVDGFMYVAGNTDMQGSPDVYGSIVSEGGFTGGGNPEIWFNWDFYAGDLGRFDIDPVYKGARREIYQ